MEDEFLNIYRRIVLTEKCPFWVIVTMTNSIAYGTELLVRPCLSEKDIEILIQENAVGMTIKGFKEYYIILKGGNFSHNLVYKSICERIKK